MLRTIGITDKGDHLRAQHTGTKSAGSTQEHAPSPKSLQPW